MSTPFIIEAEIEARSGLWRRDDLFHGILAKIKAMENELKQLRAERDAWMAAEIKTRLCRGDLDVSTPKQYEAEQARAATYLVSENAMLKEMLAATPELRELIGMLRLIEKCLEGGLLDSAKRDLRALLQRIDTGAQDPRTAKGN